MNPDSNLFKRELESAQIADQFHWSQTMPLTFHCAHCTKLVSKLSKSDNPEFLCGECREKWNAK